MNYQKNPMRYPGVVDIGQSRTEPQYGRRPTNDGCSGCEEGGHGKEIDCLGGMSLAMVYSPCQEFDDLYDHTEGLRRGTIFRQLDKPFAGRRGGF